MYKLSAYGIQRQFLKSKTFNHPPTFTERNRFANSVAKKYGAHPSIKQAALGELK